MRPVQIAGHGLLWSGFLAGAFLAVRSTEVPRDPWATINWPAFCGALAVAIAGVVVLRVGQRGTRRQAAARGGDIAEIAAVLDRVANRLESWQNERFADEAVREIHDRIDQDLSDDLALFSDLRQALVDAFGLEVFARIMTDFALGERTINRMWSASADGYIDEVRRCLAQAAEHMHRARASLHEAIRRQSSECGVGAQPSE